jgi:molecular chaperone GrpE
MSASKPESEVDPSNAEEAASVEQPSTEESVVPEEGLSNEDPAKLFAQLDALTEEANSHRDRALRAVAELENYRKRALREKDDARKFANQVLMENFLPILDNFSLGLQAAEQHEAGKAFAEGFAMVLSQINSWLESSGVECLDPVGEEFDPNLHESVAHLTHAEVPDGHIIEVNRVGYRLHSRLLRPAVVVVSKGPTENAEG